MVMGGKKVGMAIEVGKWMPRVTIFVMTGGVDVILPPNPQRLSVIFSTNTGNVIAVLPSPLVSLTTGWLVGSSGQPLEFDYWRHIAIVSSGWFGTGQAGSPLTIVEQVLVGKEG